MSINVYRMIWQRMRSHPDAATWVGPFDAPFLTSMDYYRRIAPERAVSLMDVSNQLEKGEFASAPVFLAALRRVFTNALRFVSSDAEGGMRTLAISCLHAVDDAVASQPMMLTELARANSSFVRIESSFAGWAAAAGSLERLLKATKKDGSQTVANFNYPVEAYFPVGDAPVDYTTYVAQPTCLADVSARLYGGRYSSLDEFESHVKRVFQNALAYYGNEGDVPAEAKAAMAGFKAIFEKQRAKEAERGGAEGLVAPSISSSSSSSALLSSAAVAQHALPAQTAASAAAPVAAAAAPAAPKLKSAEMKGCMEALKAAAETTHASLVTGTHIKLSLTFDYPVEKIMEQNPGYAIAVRNPIDLAKIRSKLNINTNYASPTAVSADVLLMVQNCKTFNADPGITAQDYRTAADELWSRFCAEFSKRFPDTPLASSPAVYPEPGIVCSSSVKGCKGGVKPFAIAAAASGAEAVANAAVPPTAAEAAAAEASSSHDSGTAVTPAAATAVDAYTIAPSSSSFSTSAAAPASTSSALFPAAAAAAAAAGDAGDFNLLRPPTPAVPAAAGATTATESVAGRIIGTAASVSTGALQLLPTTGAVVGSGVYTASVSTGALHLLPTTGAVVGSGAYTASVSAAPAPASTASVLELASTTVSAAELPASTSTASVVPAASPSTTADTAIEGDSSSFGSSSGRGADGQVQRSSGAGDDIILPTSGHSLSSSSNSTSGHSSSSASDTERAPLQVEVGDASRGDSEKPPPAAPAVSLKFKLAAPRPPPPSTSTSVAPPRTTSAGASAATTSTSTAVSGAAAATSTRPPHSASSGSKSSAATSTSSGSLSAGAHSPSGASTSTAAGAAAPTTAAASTAAAAPPPPPPTSTAAPPSTSTYAGPRDSLHDIDLANDKQLQAKVVDGLLVRLRKHPFADYFAESFLSDAVQHREFYAALAATTLPTIASIQYGLSAIQRVYFKDNHYPALGHLNDDINRLFDLSIGIHESNVWRDVPGRPDLAIYARVMVVRAQRLKEYWHDLLVEFCSFLLDARLPAAERENGPRRVTVLERELAPRRLARDALILPRKPVSEAIAPAARVIAHCVRLKDGKFFCKPPHEIWRSLGEDYYAAVDNKPMDFKTMRTKLEAGGYESFSGLWDDLELVCRNALRVNYRAPPGSEGAAIVSAAERVRTAWRWTWDNESVDIANALLCSDIDNAVEVEVRAVHDAREGVALAAVRERQAAREAHDASLSVSAVIASAVHALRCDEMDAFTGAGEAWRLGNTQAQLQRQHAQGEDGAGSSSGGSSSAASVHRAAVAAAAVMPELDSSKAEYSAAIVAQYYEAEAAAAATAARAVTGGLDEGGVSAAAAAARDTDAACAALFAYVSSQQQNGSALSSSAQRPSSSSSSSFIAQQQQQQQQHSAASNSSSMSLASVIAPHHQSLRSSSTDASAAAAAPMTMAMMMEEEEGCSSSVDAGQTAASNSMRLASTSDSLRGDDAGARVPTYWGDSNAAAVATAAFPVEHVDIAPAGAAATQASMHAIELISGGPSGSWGSEVELASAPLTEQRRRGFIGGGSSEAGFSNGPLQMLTHHGAQAVKRRKLAEDSRVWGE